MKKVYLMLSSLALSGMIFAQTSVSSGQLGNAYLAEELPLDHTPLATATAPTDTIGWDDFQSVSSGLALYGNVGGGYIFGVNDLGIGVNPPGVV